MHRFPRLLQLSVGLLTFTVTVVSPFFQERKEWSATESTHGRAKPKALIFRDEFNTLDLDAWSHEITMSGGGNGEFQIYQNNRSNSYVKYGKLYIKPTLTAEKHGEDFLYEGNLHLGGSSPADQCTNDLWEGCERQGKRKNILNPVVSARLRTVNSFAFKYGRVEVRAKIPSGDWLWPAVWLLPQNNQYGTWPASGEIDILEARGNADLKDKDNIHIGVEQVAQTLHFGPYHPLNGWEKTSFPTNTESGKGYDKDFHVYEVEWTPEFIKFSIDGEATAEVHPAEGGFWQLGEFPNNIDNPWKYAENPKMAPFDQKFYIVINLAVGGINSYFPDSGKGPYPKPWKNSSPSTAMLDFWKGKKNWFPTWNGEQSALVLDYIRVYAI